MPGRLGVNRRSLASRWFAGALLGALVTAAALPAAADFTLGGGAKQDKNAPIVFRADEVDYDEALALTIARGHVEISQNGQVLLADTVSYNQRTDTVTASGNVSLSQPTGEIVFADFIELRDSMNEGFAKNVRMLLADRSRLAANTARRTNGNRTELKRGVCTPLAICAEKIRAPRQHGSSRRARSTTIRSCSWSSSGTRSWRSTVGRFFTPRTSRHLTPR